MTYMKTWVTPTEYDYMRKMGIDVSMTNVVHPMPPPVQLTSWFSKHAARSRCTIWSRWRNR